MGRSYLLPCDSPAWRRIRAAASLRIVSWRLSRAARWAVRRLRAAAGGAKPWVLRRVEQEQDRSRLGQVPGDRARRRVLPGLEMLARRCHKGRASAPASSARRPDGPPAAAS